MKVSEQLLNESLLKIIQNRNEMFICTQGRFKTIRQYHFSHLHETLVLFLTEALFWGGGIPGSSVGKESACNAGDPSSIPGSGRSTGEGIGYPLQYSLPVSSLVAELVKNPPAMQETWV